MIGSKKSGRKPASAVTVGRQEIWTAIRGFNRDFTLRQLVDATGANRKTTQDYLRCLIPGGIVEQVSDGVFRLILDRGFHAPRLNRLGKPVTQGAGVENMWRSMQKLSQFSWQDVAIHSTTDIVTVSASTAKTYCSMLLKCGYLRVVQKANSHGRPAVYRLIRNNGPLPPMIQRVKQVYDPNTREVYATELPK